MTIREPYMATRLKAQSGRMTNEGAALHTCRWARRRDIMVRGLAMFSVSGIFPRALTTLRKVQMRPLSTILRYVGALSGALAVISFLSLPIVKVSFIGLNVTRTGTELIQSTFESNEVQGIAVSIALTLALIAAGLGSLLFFGDRHKRGPILGGLSLSILVALWAYLVIREESTNLIAIGLWLSLLFLAIMSISTLLVCSYSKTPGVSHDQSGEAS
ncbi:MAG: hypothetical protein NTW07_01770 [candidate division Zixibacteria bacterium]|nr:hypothetical protein [candidate division Zixibacteria bacterium]